MTTEEKYRAILYNHLPVKAVEWAYNYLDHYKVHLHITRGRRSKLGDYRWPRHEEQAEPSGKGHNFHEISVNGNLNPYMFLLVFLHEAAHLETHQRYGHGSVTPHGHEWQAEYAALLRQHVEFFPEDVRSAIMSYTRRIPLPRRIGRYVEELLHHYDKDYNAANDLHLDDLPAGSLFRLKTRHDKLFQSQEKRRTRWLCTEVATKRQYLINGIAEVEKVDE